MSFPLQAGENKVRRCMLSNFAEDTLVVIDLKQPGAK
jgi:hypothetical protein